MMEYCPKETEYPYIIGSTLNGEKYYVSQGTFATEQECLNRMGQEEDMILHYDSKLNNLTMLWFWSVEKSAWINYD